MNEHQIKCNWNELKGNVKETSVQLTNDDLDRMDGQADQLVGAIQKRYGRSVNEACEDV